MGSEQENWMRLALEQAKLAAQEDEVPIGAIIVHEGKVIGRGRNTREQSGRTSGHAEMEALLDYNIQTKQWRLPSGSSLYVTLEPCLMCTGAFLSARVSQVFFGAADTKDAGLLRVKPLIEANVFDHILEEIAGGVLQEECAQILSNYFKNKRALAKLT